MTMTQNRSYLRINYGAWGTVGLVTDDPTTVFRYHALGRLLDAVIPTLDDPLFKTYQDTVHTVTQRPQERRSTKPRRH